MDWALEFYTKQNQWSGVYEEAINEGHRLKASWVAELTGPGQKRILELGAGGGQVAAAMADEGPFAAVAAKCTATPLSSHSGTLKHFKGNDLAADECFKQDPVQGLGVTADGAKVAR